MERSEQQVQVILADGRSGTVEEGEARLKAAIRTGEQVTLVMSDGGRMLIPANSLRERAVGGYFLNRRRTPVAGHRREVEAVGGTNLSEEEAAQSGETVIPVIEEQLQVGKRQIVTGTVRIEKQVQEQEVTADEPLLHERIEVERVPMNKIVSSVPEPRQEGDVLIVPVVEEEMVIEKRLVLKEEVHLRRIREERRDPQAVHLRREEILIERNPRKPSA